MEPNQRGSALVPAATAHWHGARRPLAPAWRLNPLGADSFAANLSGPCRWAMADGSHIETGPSLVSTSSARCRRANRAAVGPAIDTPALDGTRIPPADMPSPRK